MLGDILMVTRDGSVLRVSPAAPHSGGDPVDLRDLGHLPNLTRVRADASGSMSSTAAALVIAVAPLLLRDEGDHFRAWDPEIRLGRQHVAVLTLFAPGDTSRPGHISWHQWLRSLRRDRLPLTVDIEADAFVDAAVDLIEWGLLRELEPSALELTVDQRSHEAATAFLRAAARASVGEVRDPAGRVPVYPIHAPLGQPPLALGMVVAYARSVDDGRLADVYDFRPVRFRTGDQWLREWNRHGSGVFLFSHYVWSTDVLLELSAAAKSAFPDGVTVHGGPNVPMYAGDVDAFMAQNQHVDVLVHGEGERGLVDVLDALDSGPSNEGRLALDGERLARVAGITYRTAPDSWVTTTPRPRSADLDEFPSPYLAGLFDDYEPGPFRSATIETNRGCPYGCTFCDWGSATLQRVRLFDLERVKAEVSWCARHGIDLVWIADANFGMFPRDVEIIEHLVECKRQFGSPRQLLFSFAKNHSRHVIQIMKLLEEGGVRGRRTVSLQTVDSHTLDIIRRKNIKLSVFDEIVAASRELNLLMDTDIMVGNPGSNLAALRKDLQLCIDLAVPANVFRVRMLPNSPMNEPSYRAEHRIQTDAQGWLESTSSYSAEELSDMVGLARAYKVFETGATGRYLLRFLEHELGVPMIELIEFLWTSVRADLARWPLLCAALNAREDNAVEPLSWDEFYDEMLDAIRTRYALTESTALVAAVRAQRGAMPRRGQVVPFTIDLEHDVVAYFSHRFHDRGPVSVHSGFAVGDKPGRSLSEFPPSKLEFSDPYGLTTEGIVAAVSTERELYSDLSRLFSAPASFTPETRGW